MNDCGWADVPLAVIGMSCRLPGADDLEGYWELIQRRGCALGPLPASRFDDTLYFDSRKGTPGKSYTRLGGIVAERPFNRVAYPLSDEQISGSDPVHLAFLEVAGEALRHAGIEPFEIPLRNTGVYIGNARGSLRSANLACAMHAQPVAAKLMESDAFRQLDPQLQAEIVQATAERICAANREDGGGRTNLESNRVAGLVSEAFGLSGPATAVDAACASSLVALAQAARALQHGAIDMAIVGSASYSAWTSLVIFSQAQALSSVGSFPFDARADGFVSSDGYAAVIVKTLTRALADGDRVWGVVRGIGLSSDGRGKSLWAPRREGQVLAIRRALAGGIDVSSLGYVEAHGTSTQVGDATEIAALNDGLGPLLTKAKPVPLASVKGNIGHTRETAGLAGLIKTLLAMHHGRIPPAAGFEQPNPEIPWDALPFYVPTSAQAWDRPKAGSPRRAAVDAFGIGGLNVHVLVDDEPEHGSGRAQMRVPCDVERTPAASRRGDTGCAIAIVGRGAIFPGARNYAEFQDLVSSGRDARMPVPSARWNLDQFPQLAASGSDGSARLWGGFVTGFEYDWRKRRIAPKQIAHGDPLQFMVLDAAEQAMQDAGCPEERLKRSTTAVVIGTGFGGDFSIELGLALRLPDFQRLLGEELTLHGIATPQAAEIGAEFAAAFLRRYVALADETGSYSSSTLASRVAKALDLQGGAFAVDAGGGSSSVALAAAMDMLQSHACDAVLCGCAAEP
ncbi:MAG: beta-ketoacyl synthase N-terminal-like domain-containing protein [Planctomycetaceae bacterium]